jgi:hypothetical protein
MSLKGQNCKKNHRHK